MLQKDKLADLYFNKGNSMQEIATLLNCSPNRVKYWMIKHGINRRSISDAVYLKCNPDGDPFKFSPPTNLEDAKLFGLGLGLYWGEGTKASIHSVRLGNTDPCLIKKFMEFLARFYSIRKNDLRFGLQIFSDIDLDLAMDFWMKKLKIDRSQLMKPVVTKTGKIGTYRKKSEHGVLTVMYHNKKLRDLLINMLPT